MFISRREYDLLIKQADYWQAQYERERKRADKLVENLMQTNGLPSPNLREDDKLSSDHPSPAKVKEYMAELFENEITDKLDDEAVEFEPPLPE